MKVPEAMTKIEFFSAQKQIEDLMIDYDWWLKKMLYVSRTRAIVNTKIIASLIKKRAENLKS